MKTFDSTRKFNDIQDPCRKCQNCQQYKDLISCKEGRPSNRWPIALNSDCSKFSEREVPADYISLEDSQVKELLLTAMTAGACTLIYESVSPQAVGAIEDLRKQAEVFFQSKQRPLSEIQLPSTLPMAEVSKSLKDVVRGFQGLMEGSFITKQIAERITIAHLVAERLYERTTATA